MKSYNHLFEKAISDEIMDPALDDGIKGKKDRPEIQDILRNRIKYKQILRQKIIAGDLVPFVHQATLRIDRCNGKPRIIVPPRFDKEEPEQWIHHIVIKTLKPIIMKGMYQFSCGSIPGRGIHYGKKYLEKFIKENKSEIKYVLKFDIQHFYESINVDLLKERFRKIIHDERMLKLIFYILDSNEYQLDGELYKGGLLIGFYPSQWFANFFLQPFDHFIKENKSEIKYVLKFDIHHFYESINVDLLKERFRKIIHDERMLKLIFYILDSNEYQLDGELYKGGLLIGFYPSQWFANFFLQPFDHFIKENLKVKCYVRYMDDCVIFGRNKKELHQKLYAIEQYLGKMDLELKSNYQIYRFDYIDRQGNRRGRFIDFMGFKFYRDKTTIRKGIFARATRTARRISKKEKVTWFDAARMLSYKGWFKRTNTYKAFMKYIAPFVNLGKLRRIMSNYSKRRINGTKLEKSGKSNKTGRVR